MDIEIIIEQQPENIQVEIETNGSPYNGSLNDLRAELGDFTYDFNTTYNIAKL